MNEGLDKQPFPPKVRNALLRFINMLAVRVADEIIQEHQASRQKENGQPGGGRKLEARLNDHDT